LILELLLFLPPESCFGGFSFVDRMSVSGLVCRCAAIVTEGLDHPAGMRGLAIY